MKIIPTPWLFWAQAMTITPTLILIRPERENDAALIAHEKRHCEQMGETGTARFWWRYATNREFRLQMELEAYRVQLAMHPSALDGICERLSSRNLFGYHFGLSFEEAKRLLLQPAK